MLKEMDLEFIFFLLKTYMLVIGFPI